MHNASLTLAVGNAVRNDRLSNGRSTSLLGAVAQTKAEVGVGAKAGRVRLAVGRGAAQVGLLVEHVLNAVSLDDGFSTKGVTNGQDKGQDLRHTQGRS